MDDQAVQGGHIAPFASIVQVFPDMLRIRCRGSGEARPFFRFVSFGAQDNPV
jgi:hypothetical protein